MEQSLSYVIQIFTGGFNEDRVSYKEIEDKLSPLLGKLNISRIIIGWSMNKSLYHKIHELLKVHKIPLFLWMPVFSEIGDVIEGDKVILHSGKNLEPFNLNEGEGFEFLCPSSARNIDNVMTVFDEKFTQDDFEGVFLDRIRYPSFSNGFESVFSCFCPRCQERMKQANVDIEWIKEKVLKAKETAGLPFEPIYSESLKHQFTEDKWRTFFDFKHNIVTESLSQIINQFKVRSLKIGLDVFAPSVADFLGQDIVRLSEKVDFIKPMMYYKTFAPAGVSYEKAILQEGFATIQSAKESINVNESDLKDIKRLVTQSKCDITPGFEVNYIKNVAETSVEYIEEQLCYYEKMNGINQVVLSWNLLDMPEEHIDYIVSRRK